MAHRDGPPVTRPPHAVRLTRRGVAAVLLGAVCAASVPWGGAGATEVAEAHDLARLGATARDARVPILLVVSQTFCPYCKQLEREVLVPMLLSGEYRGRVIMRELLTDAGVAVRDFDGQSVQAADIAARYRAWVTPTLLFLDDHGHEIAPRIRGINTPGLYGYYVDEAIERALARIREHD